MQVFVGQSSSFLKCHPEEVLATGRTGIGGHCIRYPGGNAHGDCGLAVSGTGRPQQDTETGSDRRGEAAHPGQSAERGDRLPSGAQHRFVHFFIRNGQAALISDGDHQGGGGHPGMFTAQHWQIKGVHQPFGQGNDIFFLSGESQSTDTVEQFRTVAAITDEMTLRTHHVCLFRVPAPAALNIPAFSQVGEGRAADLAVFPVVFRYGLARPARSRPSATA